MQTFFILSGYQSTLNCQEMLDLYISMKQIEKNVKILCSTIYNFISQHQLIKEYLVLGFFFMGT